MLTKEQVYNSLLFEVEDERETKCLSGLAPW